MILGEARDSRPPAPESRSLRVVVPALTYYPESKDGSSRLAYDEARYLCERGCEVWLVAMGRGNGEPEYLRDGSLHVLRYRRPPWAAFDPTGPHQRAVRRLLRRHVPGPVDLVHAHALLAGAAAFDLFGAHARTCYSLHSPARAELLAARRDAPVVERLRLRLAASASSSLEAQTLARCDVLTCDSRFARDLVGQIHGPAAAARLHVVPGWVDLGRFRILDDRAAARCALGWALDRPVFFSLRRFVPRTGLDALVEAAASLKRSGRVFQLVVGGDGGLRRPLMARADSLGLADTVSFPGIVPDDLLPTMYGAADAFVLPTAALECFGLIAIEALACGRPVLATPVGAIPEIIGRVEPRWLARDATAGSLERLMAGFLGGELPAVVPEELRAFVARSYSIHDQLATLTGLATGALKAA